MMDKQAAENIESVGNTTQILGFSLMGALVVIILWAAISPLNVVSIAQGSIIPTSKVQKVQHLEGGIVQNIHVREGQRVTANEPLITLSAATSEADAGEIRQRIQSLEADVVRLEAETAGRNKVIFPESLVKNSPKLIARSTDMFNARRARVETDLALQQSEIDLRADEVEEIRVRRENTRQRLKLVREQVSIGERLIKNNLSNRYDQIEHLKEANTLKSAIDEDSTALRRGQTALRQAQEELEKVKRAFEEEVQNELSKTRRDLEELQTRAEKYEDNLSRTVLRAPVGGIIKRLYVVTEGGVIRAGDTVLEIVPEDDRLIIEAELPPQDIGYVRMGQYAFVQLDSMDATRLGKIDGKVQHVSPDSLVNEEGQAYYLVQIEVDKPYFGDENDRIFLFPGMIVSAGIVLGERSVLEYLLSPFSQSSSYVFTER